MVWFGFAGGAGAQAAFSATEHGHGGPGQ